MKRDFDVTEDKKGTPIPLAEISSGSGVEPITTMDMVSGGYDLEKFMNETLVIVIHGDPREGALKILRPTVNGIAQPVIRGVKTKIKRKYVEVLARGIDTSYDQMRRYPDDPSSLQMMPMSRQAYPFSVIHDPNPNGYDWLDAIVNEAS